MNAASLKDFTQKDLAQMARQRGVPRWHEMRKDQLIRALARLAQAKREKAKLVRRVADRAGVAVKTGSNGHKSVNKPPAKVITRLKPAANGVNGNGHKASKNGAQKNALHETNGEAAGPLLKQAVLKQPLEKPTVSRPKSPVVVEKIHKVNADREHLKDLALPTKAQHKGPAVYKDRIVLLVRDPYWLHVCWELTRNSIQRARAAMAEHWHTARPVLRLLEVGDGATTSSAERVARDIEIHGGVQNWYIDVCDPPKHYRVCIGYLAAGGKFYTLARSNAVTTPCPGSSDDLDSNWTEVAENYEKIYALSGGYSDDGASGDLQELFEERLRRPMGAPIVARYGVGAERLLNRQRQFRFEVDAEIIVYGSTKPDAYVTLSGEPVKLRPDGTFTVRLSLPDKRQVLPVVASSGDGIEQRTVVLAIERNTKVMEPMIRDGND